MKRASRSAMHHIPVGGMNKIQVGYCGRDAVQYPGKGDFTDSYLFFSLPPTSYVTIDKLFNIP